MTAAARAFYDRWARLYDVLARRTPGIARLRRRAAAALDLSPGDTVVEMGCGTGANLPYLREAVGPSGRVVGLDYTRGMLGRARRLISRRDWDNVDVVHADATAPPLDEADAVLATFVVGMLDDPAGTVRDWCDLAAGGTVVLVDAARSDRTYGPLVNLPFRALVVASTPPTTRLRYDDDPTGTLDERVADARRALRDRASAVADERHALGIVRLTGGRIPEEPFP